jgi:hypothetical protein
VSELKQPDKKTEEDWGEIAERRRGNCRHLGIDEAEITWCNSAVVGLDDWLDCISGYKWRKTR